MVVVTCSIPLAILAYNHIVYKHLDTSKSDGSEEDVVSDDGDSADSEKVFEEFDNPLSVDGLRSAIE